MQDNTPNIANINLKPSKDVATKKKPKRRKDLVFTICGIVGILGGITCIMVAIFMPSGPDEQTIFPQAKPATSEVSTLYSPLTGLPVTDAALQTAPTYCIQTPNGTDGARPHSGLNEAGVIFEAIAEAGITRFAAIYQNPSAAVIGPIRSLRLYYLQWDTPFDCTIVHAGGASDALEAVASGGYKDLTENYTYMYRGTYGSRLWNNLFTTASYLKQYSSDSGNTTSNVKGFTRMTPENSSKSRVDNLAVRKLNITAAADGNTSELKPTTNRIAFNFGNWPSFNVIYNYDANSNTYLRSYENGDAHEVYSCSSENLGEKNPEDVCTLTQMAPAVVIAMVVEEKKAEDNYHEDITTIGTGDAYIFQNGTATKGKWTKNSVGEQIKFTDTNGQEIALAPGQTMFSAIPAYGSVDF